MPRVLLMLLLALLAWPGPCLAEDDKPRKRKATPPPPGIWWAKGFDSGIRRAAQEGRPVLFCVNALDTESANLMLRRGPYRGADWGRATRGYVAFPCHPGTENGPKGMSTRYVGTPAKTANDALTYVLQRFGDSLISPQHIILEPDGDLAFRKAYFTGVVGPNLLDAYLARISPPIAFTRASIDRETKIKTLAKTPDKELAATIRLLLKSNDGLAGAIVLNLILDEFKAERRLTLIRAFEALPAEQVVLAAYGAEERVTWPDDDPAETEAWVTTLLGIDPAMGAWAAARAIARSEERGLRSKLLARWSKAGSRDKAARLLEREALLLAGDKGKGGRLPSDTSEPVRWRFQRARKQAGLAERRWPELETALSDGRPAIVRGALMEADASDVGANRTGVEEALRRPIGARVRFAAALALLRAGSVQDPETVASTVLQAVFDPVEGVDARTHAVETLATDPGSTTEAWRAAINAHLDASGGGR